MPRIGLCMIVKNESHVIERCLDSVKSFVNFVLVEDTGSDDDTMEIIRAWLVRNDIPGVVYFNEWKNFAHNRSSVLTRLREYNDVDYALVMDADDEFVVENENELVSGLQSLALDSYRTKLFCGDLEFFRTQLISNRLEFKYKGVLHEFIEGPPNHSSSTLNGCFIKANREGARSKDPQKYEKDAEVLRAALQTETDPFLVSRYTFYFAQSLRDSGQGSEAVKFYKIRTKLGYWIEERYVSLLYAGRIMETLPEYSSDEVVAIYKEAIALIPTRVEAIHALARYLRLRKMYIEALELALRGYSLPVPDQGLFLESTLYHFGIKDELAVSAYWADRKDLCLRICTEIIEGNFYSPHSIERVIKNGDFAVDVLKKQIEQFQAAKTSSGFSAKPATDSISYIELVRQVRAMETAESVDIKKIILTYGQIIKTKPDRVEALYGLIRFCRQHKLQLAKADVVRHTLFTEFSKVVDDAEHWILDYGLAYELCCACAELGLNEKSLQYGLSALAGKNLPNEIRNELLEVIRRAEAAIRDTLRVCDNVGQETVSSRS